MEANSSRSDGGQILTGTKRHAAIAERKHHPNHSQHFLRIRRGGDSLTAVYTAETCALQYSSTSTTHELVARPRNATPTVATRTHCYRYVCVLHCAAGNERRERLPRVQPLAPTNKRRSDRANVTDRLRHKLLAACMSDHANFGRFFFCCCCATVAIDPGERGVDVRREI